MARRRLRAERTDVPIRRLVPNVLTTISLCSGLAAIHFALIDDTDRFNRYDRALLAVAIAAIFDVLDGRAARLLHASSPFGAQFDSLSDFVSFCVAPAVILHEWGLKGERVLGLAAVVTFVLCGALRLARFTAMQQKSGGAAGSGRFFVGMPTPAGAGAVLIPVMIDTSRHVAVQVPTWTVLALTFVVSGLMISRWPMYSLKKLRVHRRAVLPFMVLVGLTVVAALKDAWLTAAGVAAAYLLSAPLSLMAQQRARRRAPREPGEADAAEPATPAGVEP